MASEFLEMVKKSDVLLSRGAAYRAKLRSFFVPAINRSQKYYLHVLFRQKFI